MAPLSQELTLTEEESEKPRPRQKSQGNDGDDAHSDEEEEHLVLAEYPVRGRLFSCRGEFGFFLTPRLMPRLLFLSWTPGKAKGPVGLSVGLVHLLDPLQSSNRHRGAAKTEENCH